ncbi:MAG: adenylate/guanylate cyclase domain-containing protein [Polyangiaceae bacterium]
MAGLSLRAKVLLVLVPLAVAPAAAAVAWLAGDNRAAVAESERTLQLALLGEARERAHDEIGAALVDARAVAAALSESAKLPENAGDPLVVVRSVLATRRALDAARFEVPDAGVSTVLNKEEVDPARVPSSTPELRIAADRDGWAFAPVSEGRAVIVVPIPSAAGGKKGYVAAGVHTAQFRKALDDTIAAHAEEGAMAIVVADRELRAVACAGTTCDMGADLSALPVWQLAKTSSRGTAQVGLARRFDQSGVAMFGTEASLPDTGWSIAVWRPVEVAFRKSDEFARRAVIAAALVLALAAAAGVALARVLTRPILRLMDQVKLVGQRKWTQIHASTGRSDELGQLEGAIDGMAASLQESEAEIEHATKLRGDLSRFMSKDLVEAIVRGEHDLALGGHRTSITVLFADVVAFTPLSESRPPEQVVAMLNELFSVLTEVVFRHGGTVDKFIGDCIMAVWGAPVAQADHADRALAAAEDMMHFLEVASAEWRKKYDVEVRLGIGVNSGEAIVGNIGSDKRMEYTVIGDVVNVAARLEGLAAPNQVLVAEGTHALATDRFELVSVGAKNLVGRANSVHVFELVTS